MIERYTLPEMGRIFSDAHKYELWCQVETLVMEAHAAAGTIPADAVEPVRQAPPPTPEQVADNCAAADLSPLSDEAMAAVRRIYDQYARPQVHHRW